MRLFFGQELLFFVQLCMQAVQQRSFMCISIHRLVEREIICLTCSLAFFVLCIFIIYVRWLLLYYLDWQTRYDAKYFEPILLFWCDVSLISSSHVCASLSLPAYVNVNVYVCMWMCVCSYVFSYHIYLPMTAHQSDKKHLYPKPESSCDTSGSGTRLTSNSVVSEASLWDNHWDSKLGARVFHLRYGTQCLSWTTSVRACCVMRCDGWW